MGIPAHNEADRILPCIRSIFNQTIQPDKIVVILDNCTDETESISKGLGVDVFHTVNNKSKKAGALNQFISTLFDEGDMKLLIADADSELTPTFIEEALKHPDKAVGGVFYADGKNGILGNMQGLEYVRYAREIARGKAKAKVLSGTSTMLSLSWLKEVADKRGTELTGIEGEVYNTLSIVEDFDLTLCLKKLGIKTISPKGCRVVTESMPTVKELWKQRLRWQSGTIQTLFDFGFSRLTLPYFVQQVVRMVGLAMMFMLWGLSIMILLLGYIDFQPLWVGMGSLFYIERQVSSHKASDTGKWISRTVVLDICYDIFIAAVTLKSCFNLVRGRKLEWGVSTIDQLGKPA